MLLLVVRWFFVLFVIFKKSPNRKVKQPSTCDQ